MSPALTTVLAVWGAVVSTVTLIWNLWKWRQEKPQIVVRASTWGVDANMGIRFEIRNRGGRPTTVEDIRLVTYQDGIAGLLRMRAHVEYLAPKYGKTIKLPVVLASGAVWTADIPMEDEGRGRFETGRQELIEAGRLYFKVVCAHTDRRVVGKIVPESFSPWSD